MSDATHPIPRVPARKRYPYDQWSPDARALDIVGDKWTLLMVRDLVSGPRRFVELQRVLPGISTEQLRSRLIRLVADGMLTRQRYREVPPRVDYELTERAQDLLPVLGELARWGYKWAWSAPRDTEAVDIGAIFRLAPSLVGPCTAHGMVQCTVSDGRAGGGAASYSFAFAAGHVTISERETERSDAKVTGDTDSWVQAISPQRDLSGLSISGDPQLAKLLLDRLLATSFGVERAMAERRG
jgi:DNA-binding HxlR family transcriptional regulator